MKIINLKTGTGKGWQDRLHKVYNDFAEFDDYNRIYEIALRLGYKTSKEAWKANPLIQGSVNPNDLKVVKIYS